MREVFRERPRLEGEERKITLEIQVWGGKSHKIEIEPGEKVLDVLRKLNIEWQDYTLRLNGRILQKDKEGNLENPVLLEDSLLDLIQKVAAGK